MGKSLLFIISIVSVLAIGCKKNNLVHLSGKIENPKVVVILPVLSYKIEF